MLTMFAKLLAALNSESSPRQLALAIALGMVVGLTPLLNIHNLLILLLAFVLKINLSAFFLAIATFSGFAIITSAPLAGFGESLLGNPGLYQLWTGFYQVTVFKLFHFHHTLTLGSLVAGLALFLPVMLLSHWLIVSYRHSMKAFVEKFKIVQSLKSSRFYEIYSKLSGANASIKGD